MPYDIEYILGKLKETKNRSIFPKYPITFLPVNTYEQVKEYFEEDNNKKVDIIENLDNLKFETTIENKEKKKIEYTIEFKKDNILINDESICYNLDLLLPVIDDCFKNKKSNFYKKNKNGLSILTMILKNNICKGSGVDILLNKIQGYISKENIEPNEEFIKAIFEAGNVDLFKFFTGSYEHLFNKDALANACFGGNYEIIHILEDKHYEINFNTLKGACAGNDPDIVNYLLDKYYKNFDLENVDNFLNNIIELFGYIKNPEIASIFLDKIDEIIEDNSKIVSNIFDNEIVSKIYNKKEKEKIKKYSKEEKDKLVRDYLYSKLFLRAIGGSRLETMYLLFKQAKEKKYEIYVNIENNANVTLLHCAASNENPEIIQLLLTYEEIDINARNINSYTPLHYAVKNKNPEVTRLLLSHPKIDVNVKSDFKWTPLHFAVENENPEVTRLLLSHPKIDVNVKSDFKWTPLHFAVENENPEVTRFLILHPKIDINAKGFSDLVPLHNAIKCINLETIKLLLSHPKIDINAKDKSGSTPLHFAVEYSKKHPEVIKLLLSDKRLKIEDDVLMQKLKDMANESLEIKDILDIYNKNQEELKQQTTNNFIKANNSLDNEINLNTIQSLNNFESEINDNLNQQNEENFRTIDGK